VAGRWRFRAPAFVPDEVVFFDFDCEDVVVDSDAAVARGVEAQSEMKTANAAITFTLRILLGTINEYSTSPPDMPLAL